MIADGNDDPILPAGDSLGADQAAYAAQVADLSKRTAEALRAARTSGPGTEAAIRAYCRAAYAAGWSSAEVIDWFCVSEPSIGEQAGYTGEDLETLNALFDRIHDDLTGPKR